MLLLVDYWVLVLYLQALLLELFKDVDGCMSDPPKIMYFGGSKTGAAIVLESPSNMSDRLSGNYVPLYQKPLLFFLLINAT